MKTLLCRCLPHSIAWVKEPTNPFVWPLASICDTQNQHLTMKSRVYFIFNLSIERFTDKYACENQQKLRLLLHTVEWSLENEKLIFNDDTKWRKCPQFNTISLRFESNMCYFINYNVSNVLVSISSHPRTIARIGSESRYIRKLCEVQFRIMFLLKCSLRISIKRTEIVRFSNRNYSKKEIEKKKARKKERMEKCLNEINQWNFFPDVAVSNGDQLTITRHI